MAWWPMWFVSNHRAYLLPVGTFRTYLTPSDHSKVSCKSWESVWSLFHRIPWYMANNQLTNGVGQKGKSNRNAFTNKYDTDDPITTDNLEVR